MARRLVYDEPNPFAPDIRENRVASKKFSADVPCTSAAKKKPSFSRFFLFTEL